MRSDLVTLTAPTDDDFATITAWLSPSSPMTALTGDTRHRAPAETLRDSFRKGETDYWVVRTTQDGTPVGVVNSRRHGAVGGYIIGGAIADPALWSRGYGGAAFGLLVDHLFHQEGAHRVQFQTAAFNRGMIEILTRGGFTLEGILRDYHYLDGQYHDSTVWSILRSEFELAVGDPRAHPERYPVLDLVPDDDKRRARKALGNYLTSERAATSWGMFDERNDNRRSS